MIGYDERIKRDQADIIRTAYQTAAFVNSVRKPKPLAYYIDRILNSGSRRKSKEEAMKQIEWAKEMDLKIAEAKRRKEAENDGTETR